MPTHHSTRLRRMRDDGWSYFAPFGIPRDLYDAGHAKVTDWVPDKDGRNEPIWGYVRFTNRENGSVLEVKGYVADSGEWLQTYYDLSPKWAKRPT